MEENRVNPTQYSSEEEISFGRRLKGFFTNMSSVRQIFLWYLIISLTGALLLWLPISHTSEFNKTNGGFGLGFIDALFVSSSAFSDTGLSTVGISDTFNVLGQFVTLILLQIGGIGWFTIKIFFLHWILRKQTRYNDIADGSSELGTVRKQETLGLIFTAVIVSLSATLIGGLIFGSIFIGTGLSGMGPIQAFWTGIYHAATSVNNSGLDIFKDDTSVAYLYGAPGTNIPAEVSIEVITMFLFILGGVGFGIIYDIYKWINHRYAGETFSFSLVTKLSVVIYVVVALIGLSLAFISEGLAVINPENHSLLSDTYGMNASFFNLDGTPVQIDGQNVGEAWNETSLPFRMWTLTFNTFSTRNAGFSSMPLNTLQSSTQLIYCVMMFIGSGPGSTAGGIRTTTFGVLIVSLWQMARNKPQAHAFGKGIPREVTNKAFVILVGSLLLVTAEVLIISITEGVAGTSETTFLDNTFVVFSAYGTTGLSTAGLGDYHWVSKLSLIILMFIGQMGISNTISQVKTKQIRHQRQYVEQSINLG